MRLIVLGSAGSAPGADRPCSGYLVEHDGYRLLLDLGPGASMTMLRHVAAADIDAVILSHLHSDHYSDLSQMFRLRVEATREPLPLYGPPGVESRFDGFAVTETTGGEMALGPLAVRLAEVVHIEHTLATRIGDALCYTADTEPCAAIEELADGARVLLADACGSDSRGPMRGHLTAGDAARLSVKSGAKLLILTHLRPWDDHALLLAEAAAIATCPVILALPGLTVAL
ncbi:MAG TPA: MBL fold metallo-hydrolase [Micromonosporaceae bacterium]